MSDTVERLRQQILSNATSGNVEVAAIEELIALRQRVKDLEYAIGLQNAPAQTKDELKQSQGEPVALKREAIIQMAQDAGFAHAPPNFKHWRGTISDLERFAAAIRYTATTIPEGWQVVPVEPTDIHFVQLYMREHGLEVSELMVKTMHHALLAAAPKPEER